MAKIDEIEPDAATVPQCQRHARCAAAAASTNWNCSWTACCAATSRVTELLTADYTFLNEQLAQLYGIDTVKGGQFRRVTLHGSEALRPAGQGRGADGHGQPEPHRAGAARRLDPGAHPGHAAGARRRRMCGDLKSRCRRSKPATVRERIEMHRRNPACAPAMASWIRWASRWRTSTPWASSAPSIRDAGGRSTPPARCPTARRSAARMTCARRWPRAATSSRRPSPKS